MFTGSCCLEVIWVISVELVPLWVCGRNWRLFFPLLFLITRSLTFQLKWKKNLFWTRVWFLFSFGNFFSPFLWRGIGINHFVTILVFESVTRWKEVGWENRVLWVWNIMRTKIVSILWVCENCDDRLMLGTPKVKIVVLRVWEVPKIIP